MPKSRQQTNDNVADMTMPMDDTVIGYGKISFTMMCLHARHHIM